MVQKYELTDQKVRRVLECLRDLKLKSQYAVAQEYDRKYPPSRLQESEAVHTSWGDVVSFLQTAVDAGLVEKQILYDRREDHVYEAVRYYSLTQAGIQYLGSK